MKFQVGLSSPTAPILREEAWQRSQPLCSVGAWAMLWLPTLRNSRRFWRGNPNLPTEVAAQRSENDRASLLTRNVRLREGVSGLRLRRKERVISARCSAGGGRWATVNSPKHHRPRPIEYWVSPTDADQSHYGPNSHDQRPACFHF